MVGTPAPVGRFRHIQHINKGTPVGRSVPQKLLSWGYLSVPNLLTRSSARIPAYQLSLTIFYDTLLPSVRPLARACLLWSHAFLWDPAFLDVWDPAICSYRKICSMSIDWILLLVQTKYKILSFSHGTVSRAGPVILPPAGRWARAQFGSCLCLVGGTLSSVKPCLYVRFCLPWCVETLPSALIYLKMFDGRDPALPCPLWDPAIWNPFIWRCFDLQETGDHCCPDSPLRITCDGSAHRLCTNLSPWHCKLVLDTIQAHWLRSLSHSSRKLSNSQIVMFLCPLSCCHIFSLSSIMFPKFPCFLIFLKVVVLTPFGSHPPNFSVV